jgi:catechol 2,3-dioxygenase-like lactoylglutathione lyase family enzyme
MMTEIRGIDHVGITVDDMEIAHRFLEEGLGAEFLYEALPADASPVEGDEFENLLGLPQGTRLHNVRMYGLAVGPGIEVFHYTSSDQRPSARASDYGMQHLAVYSDDIDATVVRLVEAGGVALSKPWPLHGIESGEGNRLCFVKAPFGMLVEVLTYPGAQPYEQTTTKRRWKPPLAPS